MSIEDHLEGLKGRKRAVATYLWGQGKHGATWGDVADALGLHHGSASGALSALHKDGRVVRLRQKRGRSSVYLLTQWAYLVPMEDRVPYRPNPDKVPGLATVPEPSNDLNRGYQMGLRDGRNQGEAIAFDAVEEFTERLVAACKTGAPVAGMHHSRCYIQHPMCMAKAMKSFVTKSGAMT